MPKKNTNTIKISTLLEMICHLFPGFPLLLQTQLWFVSLEFLSD